MSPREFSTYTFVVPAPISLRGDLDKYAHELQTHNKALHVLEQHEVTRKTSCTSSHVQYKCTELSRHDLIHGCQWNIPLCQIPLLLDYRMLNSIHCQYKERGMTATTHSM